MDILVVAHTPRPVRIVYLFGLSFVVAVSMLGGRGEGQEEGRADSTIACARVFMYTRLRLSVDESVVGLWRMGGMRT